MTSKSTDKLNQALEQRFGTLEGVGDVPGDVGALTRLAGRRTCRSYEDRPVDQSILQTLCAIALSAPSKSDLQQADIIRVSSHQKRQVIADLIPSMNWVRTAPEFLVFCGNNRRLRQISERRGKVFANDHLDAFFNASVDAGIVMAFFVVAAEAAGLGCCPISVIRNHAERISDLLELPNYVIPVAGLTLGWPNDDPPIRMRLPLSVTLHDDRFDESDALAAIEGYDQRRREAQPYRKQRSSDLYGTVADYGWMEEKARHYSFSERADFGAFVRKKGFRLD